jgi:hypothetical protein
MDADLDLEAVCALLDEHWSNQAAPAFVRALAQLARLAEFGDLDAAERYAGILAAKGPHFDPAAAYKWYFIALGQQGYSTAFLDANGDPPHYRGPVGDFRNESMVGELVETLGFERIHQLDHEARAWLAGRI